MSVDLDKLDAIEAKATASPWFYNSYSSVFSRNTPEYDLIIEELMGVKRPLTYEEKKREYDADPAICYVPAQYGDTATGRHAIDADFIAELRNAYPEISKEIRALREVVAAYENRDWWANSEYLEDRQAAQIRLEKAIAKYKAVAQ